MVWLSGLEVWQIVGVGLILAIGLLAYLTKESL